MWPKRLAHTYASSKETLPDPDSCKKTFTLASPASPHNQLVAGAGRAKAYLHDRAKQH